MPRRRQMVRQRYTPPTQSEFEGLNTMYLTCHSQIGCRKPLITKVYRSMNQERRDLSIMTHRPSGSHFAFFPPSRRILNYNPATFFAYFLHFYVTVCRHLLSTEYSSWSLCACSQLLTKKQVKEYFHEKDCRKSPLKSVSSVSIKSTLPDDFLPQPNQPYSTVSSPSAVFIAYHREAK
jgi:hypothetical protein